MNVKYLEYLLDNNPYPKNTYKNDIVINLPDIHLEHLESNNFKYRFREAEKRYQRPIDILRKDGSIVTTIKPPSYTSNDDVSFRLVRNKIKTEEYLKKFNIPTPQSKVFYSDQVEAAEKAAFNNSDNPVVIKPLYGTLGKGVRMNVGKDRFKYNWQQCTKSLGKYDKILVQKYIEGFEARATVIEGAICAITVRIPPYVIGDGKNTVDELINIKNTERRECGFLKHYSIKKTEPMIEFLKSSGIELTDIPKENETLLLGGISNLSTGGELFNITDLVSQNIKDLALNTVASFPGLYTAGLDIMLKSFDDAEPTILEVNSFPVIALAAFPTYGQYTDPAKNYIEAIIARDQYINNLDDNYSIENSTVYIQNYLDFMLRKNTQINNNSKSLLQYF